MYIPRDTERQTQPLHQFRRKHFTEVVEGAPPPKPTVFNKVSYSKKRVRVNRPHKQIRLVNVKKSKYAFLRAFWFWLAVFSTFVVLHIAYAFFTY